MPCAVKIGGVAYLKVDGYQYMLRGDLTITPGRFSREGIAGQDGIHGYTETPTIPKIAATITDTAGLSIDQLWNVVCSTVTAELSNGKVYILRDAWVSAVDPLNTSEGSIAVTFQGMACQELLAGPATALPLGVAA